MLKSIPNPSPDPTAALRQARMEALTPQVSRDAVIAALQQLVLDTTFERTNALTRALDDVLAHPPEDRWQLDGLITRLPYRYRVDVGGAVVRLIGEAWLHVAGADEQPFERRGDQRDHARCPAPGLDADGDDVEQGLLRSLRSTHGSV